MSLQDMINKQYINGILNRTNACHRDVTIIDPIVSTSCQISTAVVNFSGSHSNPFFIKFSSENQTREKYKYVLQVRYVDCFHGHSRGI